MAAILDIMISFVMGGMLLLNVLNAEDVIAETSSMYNGDVYVQEMLIQQVQQMEGELRNMGYGVPSNVPTIIDAHDTTITFLVDLNSDGAIDTVQYYSGSVSELSRTPNTMDRYIHRFVKTGATPSTTEATIIGVVTYFRFRYFSVTSDTLDTPVAATDLGSIRDVEISIEVQNPQALYRPPGMVSTGQSDALYSTSYWQQTRLVSQNFRR